MTRAACWRALFYSSWSAEKISRALEKIMKTFERTAEPEWLEQPSWRFKRFQTRWKPRRPYNWDVYGL